MILRVSEDFQSHPERTLQAVLGLQRRLQRAAIPGVVEYAPAYVSLGIFFDLRQCSDAGAPADGVFDWMKAQIESTLAQRFLKWTKHAEPPLIEVPVCYDGEFALDLEDVSQHTKLSPSDVVRRHSAAKYRVHCVGFTPGFPYLGGLPAELATPRRATPRKQVPAGAVAIGGVQTGVYPTASPGGWNVIGRTPLRLFDAHRETPALLSAGMRVRFRAITRAEFEEFRP